MLWKERQEKVEEFTYNSINDIADEIGVDAPFYPEVYWVGRKLRFEDLGLSHRYKKEFDMVKRERREVYLIKLKIILIGGYFLEDIGEEVGHFLHLNSSGINNTGICGVNNFCLQSIVEMFGFFCSKLIKPSRKNYLRRCKDYFPKDFEEECIKEQIRSFWTNTHIFEPFSEIYSHGYRLGEDLFNTYISGIVSADKIKKLLINPLKKENEPFKTFVELKYNMVEFMNNP